MQLLRTSSLTKLSHFPNPLPPLLNSTSHSFNGPWSSFGSQGRAAQFGSTPTVECEGGSALVHPDEDSFFALPGTSRRLGYIRFGPDSGADQVVVALHSLSANAAFFEPIAGALAFPSTTVWPSNSGSQTLLNSLASRSAATVYSVDVAGRGKSDWLTVDPSEGLTEADYGLETYTKDSTHFINEVRKRHPNAQITLLGSSMGGLISLRIAGRPDTADLVDRVALIDIGPDIDPEAVNGIVDWVNAHCALRWNSLDGVVEELKAGYKTLAHDPSEEWLERLASKYTRSVKKDTFYPTAPHFDPAIAKGSVARTLTCWEEWEAVKVPVLAVNGTLDNTLVPPPLMEQMRARFNGPSLSTIHFEDIGHPPQLWDGYQIAQVVDWITTSSEHDLTRDLRVPPPAPSVE